MFAGSSVPLFHRLVYILCQISPTSSCWIVEAVPAHVLTRMLFFFQRELPHLMARLTSGSHWNSGKSCSRDLRQDILLPGSLGHESMTLLSWTLTSNRAFYLMFWPRWGDPPVRWLWFLPQGKSLSSHGILTWHCSVVLWLAKEPSSI